MRIRSILMPWGLAAVLIAGTATAAVAAVETQKGPEILSTSDVHHRLASARASAKTTGTVTIYLDNSITDGQKTRLGDKLRADKRVKAVRFEDQAAAYRKFKHEFKDSPELVKATRPESLPERFVVSLVSAHAVNGFLRQYQSVPGVERVAGQGS